MLMPVVRRRGQVIAQGVYTSTLNVEGFQVTSPRAWGIIADTLRGNDVSLYYQCSVLIGMRQSVWTASAQIGAFILCVTVHSTSPASCILRLPHHARLSHPGRHHCLCLRDACTIIRFERSLCNTGEGDITARALVCEGEGRYLY